MSRKKKRKSGAASAADAEPAAAPGVPDADWDETADGEGDQAGADRPPLPNAYVRRMEAMLGDEAEAFLRAYREPRAYGLRLNGRKLDDIRIPRERLRERFRLEPVPWCPDGFYYAPETRPGPHPYHMAGLYYIQEPSAMLPAELLDVRPGEIVLDLAAAPGGKATQIAARLDGRGLIVANEVNPVRARALVENIERMGLANAVVLNEHPGRLAMRFPAFFDAVLLDAPCSGEGMFRKNPDAVRHWSEAVVRHCAALQADILDEAAKMVRPGGRLVYSTCTFNREENEETIARFLERRPDFELRRSLRLWPHRERGEGHFAALLVRRRDAHAIYSDAGTGRPAGARPARGRGGGFSRAPDPQAFARFRSFAQEALPGFSPEEDLPEGGPLVSGGQLFWLPDGGGRLGPHLLDGLRAIRPGLCLGELPRTGFVPSHALALRVRASSARHILDFAADAPEVAAYLRGETLTADASLTGWVLMAVDGLPLGWGKAVDGRINNRLPKGLRRP
ncbi:RsmB/NOP family class I SAM-dependent RNA methyltransferase [Thermobacillus sp. ZCTH02-B1]|uniref:RsmB/NOP family class I SAM-dependent RNA methyltransferase n=1 Tax=Thermobacillus sp. ZCTH02-B1 TaxID=1858795 RepID=UPI0025F1E7BA|nr:RsmB/NOP family class I SAM-dependent RNA methyltransferase [Thermobacillus sp. ZCTH02-B1]